MPYNNTYWSFLCKVVGLGMELPVALPLMSCKFLTLFVTLLLLPSLSGCRAGYGAAGRPGLLPGRVRSGRAAGAGARADADPVAGPQRHQAGHSAGYGAAAITYR